MFSVQINEDYCVIPMLIMTEMLHDNTSCQELVLKTNKLDSHENKLIKCPLSIYSSNIVICFSNKCFNKITC